MSSELAVQPFVKASTQLSQFLGVEPSMMIETIKRQCFRGMNADQVTDAQLAAFVSVANSLKFNPLLPGFLYAYPERNGGITPIIGPDGMYKMLSENPVVDSWETIVFPADVTQPPTHATTNIWRVGHERPMSYTALISEWKVASNPNWQNRPRHMIGIRSLKQCARQIVHGIPFDEDERKLAEMTNVTDSVETQPEEKAKRRLPPAKSNKGAAAVVENEKPVEMEVLPEVAPIAEPSPVVDETPAKPEPRTSISEGETIHAIVKVLKSEATAQGSLWVQVSGDYEGEIFQQGGANNPLWADGNVISITATGKMSKAKGGVRPVVEKVESFNSEEI